MSQKRDVGHPDPVGMEPGRGGRLSGRGCRGGEAGDAGFEEFEGLVDADVVFWIGEVGVAYVEAHAYAVEVADVEDFQDVFGSGDFVLQVFDEDAGRRGDGRRL